MSADVMGLIAVLCEAGFKVEIAGTDWKQASISIDESEVTFQSVGETHADALLRAGADAYLWLVGTAEKAFPFVAERVAVSASNTGDE